MGITDELLPKTKRTFTFDKFVPTANAMADSMQKRECLLSLYLAFFCRLMILTLDFPNKPLLKFKPTGHVYPRGHVTDTECRPDITAAFETDWTKDNTTLWPCIRLAGERASKGKSRDTQEKQAISYLHYLLLARPDLHVAHGLLTREDTITFLGGIGGYGVRSFEIPWTRKSTA